jgi:hypothetical protein
MGEESDGLTISFPLRMPRPTETVALFENTTTSKEEKLRIPEDAYPSETRLELLTSATALSGLRGSIDYLTDYPYLCLEQRLSSILPYLVAKDVLVDFKLSSLTLKEMQEYVQKTLTEIYDYQKDNGGFGLWPDSRHVSPYISCYAAFALAKAQQSDYKIDQQRTGRLIRYLQNMVRGKLNRQNFPYSQKTWKTINAFAMYALSLHNQSEPSYAEKLFTERDSLSLFAKTLLLKALNKGKGSQQSQNTLVQELINKAKVSPTTAHFEDDEGRKGRWIYSSNNRTTAFILQSLLDVGSNNPLIPSVARWLVERRKAGVWTSTQENFYVFYALNDFYQKHENIDPDFKIQIFLAGKLLLEETFNTVNRTERAEISLQDKKPGKVVPLKIKKKGQGTLYYLARLSYAPKRALEPRDEGFILRKNITNLAGQPVDSVQAGSLVVVTLQVVLPRESLFVVLNDPLPAGLEAVNPTFLTESEEQQRRLREMGGTQQRWRWWQGFNHIEMLDDRVLLFADSLLPGVHTHRYLARALTPGTFHAPGAKIEEMYSPEVFGRSSEIKIKVIQ